LNGLEAQIADKGKEHTRNVCPSALKFVDATVRFKTKKMTT